MERVSSLPLNRWGSLNISALPVVLASMGYPGISRNIIRPVAYRIMESEAWKAVLKGKV